VALAVGLLITLALLEYGNVWPVLFNAADITLAEQARAFTLALWIGVALSLPLAIPPVVYRSDQQVHLAALAEASTAIVRAFLIILVVQFDLGHTAVAVAAAVAPVAIGLAVSVPIFRFRVGWPTLAAVRRSLAKRLVGTGLGFLGIGIAALIISSADVLIIAQLMGPSSVPAYSVALSLLMLYLSLEVAVMDGLWPAYVDAAAKRERGWILATHRTALIALTIAGLVFAAGLVALGQTLIEMWAGAAALPPQSLLWVFGAIAILQAMVLVYSRVLIGLGRVRIVTKLSVFGAIVNLPTSVVLGAHYGLTGVALGTLIAYGVVLGLNIAEASRAFDAIEEDVREAGPR
jgi:O-antigen/teichoic acid export membrane protein